MRHDGACRGSGQAKSSARRRRKLGEKRNARAGEPLGRGRMQGGMEGEITALGLGQGVAKTDLGRGSDPGEKRRERLGTERAGNRAEDLLARTYARGREMNREEGWGRRRVQGAGRAGTWARGVGRGPSQGCVGAPGRSHGEGRRELGQPGRNAGHGNGGQTELCAEVLEKNSGGRR
jgi:hypothetical protein